MLAYPGSPHPPSHVHSDWPSLPPSYPPPPLASLHTRPLPTSLGDSQGLRRSHLQWAAGRCREVARESSSHAWPAGCREEVVVVVARPVAMSVPVPVAPPEEFLRALLLSRAGHGASELGPSIFLQLHRSVHAVLELAELAPVILHFHLPKRSLVPHQLSEERSVDVGGHHRGCLDRSGRSVGHRDVREV